MNGLDAYLAPRCRPWTLDSFGNRRLLLAAVERALPHLSGTVLDLGCGRRPYESLILRSPSRASRYVALDLHDVYGSRPDVVWDGRTIPLADSSVDCAMLTEVLEHCSDPGAVLAELARVLRPGGFLFLTIPFIWPIHDVPHDEFRYTPFALRRILQTAGFSDVTIEGTGGRHAVLALTLGLWVRRRPLTSRVHLMTRRSLSVLLWPVIWLLLKLDERPTAFGESTLLVGLCGTARRAAA